MKYYQLISSDGDSRLAVESREGVLTDLTSLDDDLVDVEDLALAAHLCDIDIDRLTEGLLGGGEPDTYQLSEIVENSRSVTGDLFLDRPFDSPEIWAAGVTYQTSEMERRRESDTPDIYSSVYVAERPELFLKATSDRCVGPFESVGIRADSVWNVPEPELGFVLYKGRILGYTVGNDMSSRSIEGENPLYLPQAKIYDRCCSIGPCLVTDSTVKNPHNLTVRCSITRDGVEVFVGEASTAQMVRKCEQISDWIQRHNSVMNMTTVLTGTGIVPPPGFTLQAKDVVIMSIQNIGTLENDVVVV